MPLYELVHYRLGSQATKDDFPPETKYSKLLGCWLSSYPLERMATDGFGIMIKPNSTSQHARALVYVTKDSFTQR